MKTILKYLSGVALFVALLFAQTQTAIIPINFSNFFFSGLNGAICNGTADDTAALNALILKVYNAGGGTITVYGTCKIAGAVVFPNNGATNPAQPTIRITGTGPSANGGWVSALPASPSTLNLTYNASVAKLDTRGLGLLEIDHLVLKDTGSDCASFIQTTNTTIHVHDVAFSGTAHGSSACNDAVVFGGTTTTTTGGGSNGAFQGYGSTLQNVFFDQIKRGFYVRCFGNNIFLDHLTWSSSSGGATGGTVDGSCYPGQAGVGTVMSNFLEEVTGYTYGLDFVSAGNTQIFGMTQWDMGIPGIHVTGNANATSISCHGCTLSNDANGPLKDDAGGTNLAQYNPDGVQFGNTDATHCRIRQNVTEIDFKLNDNSGWCPVVVGTLTSNPLSGFLGSGMIGLGAGNGGNLVKSTGAGGPVNYPGGITSGLTNVAADTGANNAIVASIPALTTLLDGMRVTVRLAHTLQAGANTFSMNSFGVSNVKSSLNVANNIATPFASGGTVDFVWNAPNLVWQVMGQ